MEKSDNPFLRVLDESPNQPYQADWDDDNQFIIEYLFTLMSLLLMLPPFYNHFNLLLWEKKVKI